MLCSDFVDFRLVILMLTSGNKNIYLYHRVTLNIHPHVTYFLTDDNLVLYRNITALQVADKLAEALGAGIDVHADGIGYFLIVLHDQFTAAEWDSVGMNAGRQVLHVYGFYRCMHVFYVLYQPAVAVQRNREGIGEHFRIVEHRVLVLYIYREIIGERYRLIID